MSSYEIYPLKRENTANDRQLPGKKTVPDESGRKGRAVRILCQYD